MAYVLTNRGLGDGPTAEDIAALANPSGTGTGTPNDSIVESITPYMVPDSMQPPPANKQAVKINPLYIAGGLAAVFVLVSMMGGRRR